MIMTLQDQLFLAPIEDPKHILDVGESHKSSLCGGNHADHRAGTGTGVWATFVIEETQ